MLSFTIRSLQPFVLGIAFVLLYLAENLIPEKTNPSSRRHDLVNIGIGTANAVFNFGAGYLFQLALGYLNQRSFGLFNHIVLPAWIALLLQFILLDLYMYWWHRINHTTPIFWRFHRFHHLDQSMNSTTALRFHTVELLFSYLARLLVFPLLGFSWEAIILYSLVFFPVVLLHHSNIRISVSIDSLLRRLIVSPRMHRIHHSKKFFETNSNYGSVFPVWDKLFGSYRKFPSAPVEFGVD